MNEQKISHERLAAYKAKQTVTSSPKAVPDNAATPAQRGVDPYNTSGNFDRAKNWVRVGRR